VSCPVPEGGLFFTLLPEHAERVKRMTSAHALKMPDFLIWPGK
jgi:hypothetical protein